jgi:serine/threonine-protein kinase
MNEPHDPNRTVAVPSTPADSLDAGLAAGFGRPTDGPGSVLEGLRSRFGPLQPVLLGEAEGESAHIVQPKSDAMPTPEQTGDRYQLQGEIARGGMGAVLRGRDVDLGRDLAVKVLLEKYADRPDVVQRFLDEAQVGAQLQHPGVVPVYDIGRFGARPFFTMKLVKGHTLAALLAERTDPAADRPRLLGIALQVAQTLAYAHAKGVIHRDLKPGNIMVGAFGEVQVMDWGLAKVLQEGGIADEEKASRAHQEPEDVTTIRTARSSTAGSGTDTEAGTLLGTPAYMPPEQANGDVALLDRRADVFGLGAILCEVLTGKPPYVGRSKEEVRRKAANGDLADARSRLDGCAADAELIALTRACLSPEAIDRPKDARAVADALAAYQGGVQARLHQAELAEAEARARAVEEARRRRLTLALASTALLAVTLGGGAWLWLKADRDARQAQLMRDVNAALNNATEKREQARVATAGSAALFAQAREQTQRAQALIESGLADAALRAQVEQLQSELDAEEKDRRLIAALDESRLAQAETLVEEERFASERAVPLFREAFHVYGLPAGQGDPQAAAARIHERPAAVREAISAALDEWIDLATRLELRISEPHLAWLRAVAAAEPAEGWTRQFRAAREHRDAARRWAALEKLAAEALGQQLPARALTRLAQQLRAAPTRSSMMQLLRRARQQHPADFWTNYDLGTAFLLARPPQHEEAVRYLTAAVAVRPDSPGAHYSLGIVLGARGKLDEAIATYRQVIALAPRFAKAHFNLGKALQDQGKVDDAIASYRQAIAVDPGHARAYTNLGVAFNATGKVDQAIECYRQALTLDPKDARAHNNLGGILCDVKREYDAAIASFLKALAIHPNYAEAHTGLGNALGHQGRIEEAIASYRQAIALDPKHHKAHTNLGLALVRTGRVEEAIASYRRAIQFAPKLAPPYISLGAILCDVKRDYDGAIACFHKAIALDPKNAATHTNLGNALRAKGLFDEAIASYRQALGLDPRYASGHNGLGLALQAKGRFDEAIACFRQALALEPKNVYAHYNLGLALQAQGQVEEAITCYRKVIALDPKFAYAHNNLGIALQARGKVEEAIACYRKVIALDPKFAYAHTLLGGVLTGKGKLDEAIACYQRAIALDPTNAQPHAWLGHAQLARGGYAEARDASAQALQLLPANHPMRAMLGGQLRRCRRLLKLQERLPGLLRGEDRPASAQEALDLVTICRHGRKYAAAVRFSAAAFATDPRLAGDPQAGHRYSAACYACLAATDQGEDAAGLDTRERLLLRRQALTWLRAELAAWARRLAAGQPATPAVVYQRMRHWQQDSDLAAIREPARLAKLPAEEGAAFRKLWADVAALLKKAEEKAR